MKVKALMVKIDATLKAFEKAADAPFKARALIHEARILVMNWKE